MPPGQVCLQAGLNPNIDVANCGELELSRLYEQSRKLIALVAAPERRPLHRSTGGAGPWILPPYMVISEFKERIQSLPSMNEALARFYEERMASIRLDSARAVLKKKMGERQDKACKKYAAPAGGFEKVPRKSKSTGCGVNCSRTYASQLKKGDLAAVLDDYSSGEKLEIPLDPRYSPIQNAQRYYKNI